MRKVWSLSGRFCSKDDLRSSVVFEHDLPSTNTCEMSKLQGPTLNSGIDLLRNLLLHSHLRERTNIIYVIGEEEGVIAR